MCAHALTMHANDVIHDVIQPWYFSGGSLVIQIYNIYFGGTWSALSKNYHTALFDTYLKMKEYSEKIRTVAYSNCSNLVALFWHFLKKLNLCQHHRHTSQGGGGVPPIFFRDPRFGQDISQNLGNTCGNLVSNWVFFAKCTISDVNDYRFANLPP